MRVRPEQPADIPAITAVTIAAFALAEHAGHNEHLIVDALRRSGQLAVSLVAEDDAGVLIGHVALSPVAVSDGARDWYGLGPISVVPVRQGRGVGTLLMQAALKTLRRLDAAGCVLVGDPGYYVRFGFRNEPALVYPGLPAKYFQAIAFKGEVPRGTVAYHESFSTPC